jgi:hypothetical protein
VIPVAARQVRVTTTQLLGWSRRATVFRVEPGP